MKSNAKRIEVLRNEIIVLRGLRLSPDRELAEAAVIREGEVQGEINHLEETERQPELLRAHAA